MPDSRPYQQLFELWHQSSLSALSVNAGQAGLRDFPSREVERAFLAQAQKSWDIPQRPAD
ncbi:hypothetical protein [Aestuariivita boseongensis]|uniref:hypothetical protein n=1 Tax=Aestuariivita boseongensis TaxID=1470562 RepID=UPI0006814166|nr:hypothetical protein [Aestuariivita boseongensis]